MYYTYYVQRWRQMLPQATKKKKQKKLASHKIVLWVMYVTLMNINKIYKI